MSAAKDSRQCPRCAKAVETVRDLDAPHPCPHGVKCTLTIWTDCPACYVAARARQQARERRHAEVFGQVAASIAKPDEVLAALGGTAKPGIASKR